MGWEDAAAGADQDAAEQAPAQPQASAATQPGTGSNQEPTASPTPAAAAPASSPAPGTSPDGVSFPATNPPAPQPAVVTSAKPGGIKGLIQSLGEALTGKTRPEIGTDQYGNQYVKQVTPTGGQRWAKIAAQALVGAARGFAAGKGGNPGAAVAAGVDQGTQFGQQRQQQQKDMSMEARQQNLDRANNQLLTQKIAEQTMAMKRMGVLGTREAIDFSEKQQDWMAQHSDGGQPIGYVSNLKDVAQLMNNTPGFHESHIIDGRIQPVQLYDKDGKANGFAVYQLKTGTNDEMMPAGTTVYQYDAVNDKMVPHQTSQPMKGADVFATNNSAAAAMNEAHLKAAQLEHTKAETAASAANASKIPSEIDKNKAEADRARAAATKDRAPDKDDPKIASLGEAIVRGSLTEDQVPGFSKLKPSIEAYIAEHHPNLDQKSVLMDAGQRKQVNLANNAIHNLDDIATRLQRRPDLLGIINGRITQGKDLAGTDDRDLADINAALDNYALASTGAHGIRAVQARADAKLALLNGFKNGPNGVAAAMAAAKGSLQNLASAGKPRGTDGNPYVYKAQPAGGMITVQIPGSPAGQIPATAVEQFKKDHPNAVVSQ